MSKASFKVPSFFAMRLRSRRAELGLSQEKVGLAIGLDESCSRTRISRYETSTHEPAIATAQLLARALGVPLAYLYCENDTMAEIIRVTTLLEINEQARVLAFIHQHLSDHPPAKENAPSECHPIPHTGL